MLIRRVVYPLLMMLAACSAAPMPEAEVPSVPAEATTINRVRIISGAREIHARLGSPDRVVQLPPSEVVEGEAREFHYGGMTIYIVGDEILHLECSGPRCVTDKGIRTGDSYDALQRAYGPSPMRDGKVRYTFKRDGKWLDCQLIFRFSQGRIVSIIYFVDYT